MVNPRAGIDVVGPVSVMVLPLTLYVYTVPESSVTVRLLVVMAKPLGTSVIAAGGPHVTEPSVKDEQVVTENGTLVQEPPDRGLPGLVNVRILLPGELTLKIGALNVGTDVPTTA